MDNNRISLLEELHYHRVFMRTDRAPFSLDVEPLVNPNEMKSFISDVFNHALFLRGFENWISPFNTEEINKDNSVKGHFKYEIGKAVIDKCAVGESVRIAIKNGFDANKLLNLPSNEVMEYVQKFIGLVVAETRPVNISFINAFAFACTLYDVVAKNRRQHLNCIALSVASVFESAFPYEWIYYDFQQWAFAYVFRHRQIHN
ncbi:unnamed protein product [Larinioides sclopetarius]|uniref:Uncharacterized protein n=1 Tax=Larinioides sclopetarius TaxID=280406 RepID=A0AAV1Z5J6_9ARAC